MVLAIVAAILAGLMRLSDNPVFRWCQLARSGSSAASRSTLQLVFMGAARGPLSDDRPLGSRSVLSSHLGTSRPPYATADRRPPGPGPERGRVHRRDLPRRHAVGGPRARVEAAAGPRHDAVARPCGGSSCRRPCGSSCRRPATRPSACSRTPRCSRGAVHARPAFATYDLANRILPARHPAAARRRGVWYLVDHQRPDGRPALHRARTTARAWHRVPEASAPPPPRRPRRGRSASRADLERTSPTRRRHADHHEQPLVNTKDLTSPTAPTTCSRAST